MSTDVVGVIAAAGKGLRLRPKTNQVNKAMVRIGGVPLLERTIGIMRDEMGIRKIHVLVGHMKDQVLSFLGDGTRFGVEFVCTDVKETESGLARGLLQLKGQIRSSFCLMLGDEVYRGSNHRELLRFLGTEFDAVCGVMQVRNPLLIRKNYSVEVRDGLITAVVEKPETIANNFLGCGTILFNPIVFEYIEKTPRSKKTNRVELIDTVNLMAEHGEKICPFFLKGDYVNINNIDDYNSANYLMRDADFARNTLSVVIPAYREEQSIGLVVENYRERANEVIVVNTPSNDDTAKVAAEAGARVITGQFRGYGEALKVGMDNANGDIIVLTEADGSFYASDLGKILEYLKDADMVVGTRTTKQMIEQAANMPVVLRLGNLCVAKLIELLWLHKREPRLTDVGCTYRGIWKTAYHEIRDSLHGTGPEFSPEMIIEVMRCNMRMIEIPVTYSGRIAGESKLSGSMFGIMRTALRMLALIFRKRIGIGS